MEAPHVRWKFPVLALLGEAYDTGSFTTVICSHTRYSRERLVQAASVYSGTLGLRLIEFGVLFETYEECTFSVHFRATFEKALK